MQPNRNALTKKNQPIRPTVACFVFSRMLRDSIPCFDCPSVRPLTCWLVGPHFTFLAFLSILSSLLLPKCPSNLLHHRPCPPTRDQGSRVSRLVQIHTQLHAYILLFRCVLASLYEGLSVLRIIQLSVGWFVKNFTYGLI